MFKENDVSEWSLSDRFIPRRSAADFDYSYHLINNADIEEPFDYKNVNGVCDLGFVLSAKKQYYKQNYITCIRNAILPKREKVLDFSLKKRNAFCMNNDERQYSWPVIPRSKPLINLPAWVLDMPNLDVHFCRQVVDWGKDGTVAAIHEGEVHFWHPTKTLKRLITETNGHVRDCIKWNTKGTHLAMAKRASKIAVFDFQAFKKVDSTKCHCFACTVTTMVWTKYDNLITGCSNGRVSFWTKHLELITDMKLHTGEIINIKLSSTENNLVTSGVDKTVKYLIWPSSEPLKELYYAEPVKAIDWHPWRNSLLAVAGDNSLAIYNVNTFSLVDWKQHSPNIHSDCLTFNPVSGELLLSQYIGNQDDFVTRLSVMKNPGDVVDEITYKYGRFIYLLWDGTGTKLATAGSDENLCIWNFFGRSTETEKKFLKMRSKNHTTNMFRTLDMFDSKIR